MHSSVRERREEEAEALFRSERVLRRRRAELRGPTRRRRHLAASVSIDVYRTPVNIVGRPRSIDAAIGGAAGRKTTTPRRMMRPGSFFCRAASRCTSECAPFPSRNAVSVSGAHWLRDGVFGKEMFSVINHLIV
ncbi:hypothetical protein MRX96_003687 [Rhipicephalus microplus]